MKVKVVLSVITIMVGMAGLGFFQSYQAHAMPDNSEPNLNEADQVKILSATLQIEITVPLDSSGKRLVKAEGLGSLAWDGEKTLLVTHNHWGEALQEKSTVTFYDGQGNLVKSISGAEFISLMCYLDAGSLILSSPLEGVEQAQPVTAEDPLQVQARDIVLVAQREGLERKEVTLIEAEVESVTTIRGVPVYRLKGLDERLVQAGDSGGGVWHEGMLVGNLWYTSMARSKRLALFSWLKSDEANLKVTDESYAALYPAEQFTAIQESPASDNMREMSSVP
jgi:hypothetical protein